MSKKEELSEQYRRKVHEVSQIIERYQYNSNIVIPWNYEIVAAFKSGWDAAIKEIKVEIERRRNESMWAEYNEALDDMLSFLYTIKK